VTAARCVNLVRHASHGGGDRLIGSTDLPLDEAGRRQAAALAGRLASREIKRIVTSPLARCRQTAAALAASASLPIEVDPDLREVDFGRWEGLTFTEAAQREPETLKQWLEKPDEFTFPGGESVPEFWARVGRAVVRLSSAPDNGTLAVTHGGVVRAAICHVLGLPPRNYILFDVRTASLTTLTVFGAHGVLSGLNEFAG
jgi:alpha-ribazole phosphatase